MSCTIRQLSAHIRLLDCLICELELIHNRLIHLARKRVSEEMAKCWYRKPPAIAINAVRH